MCVRHSFVCALMLFASCSMFAQGSDRSLVENLAQHWEKSKSLALAIAQTVPENLYLFKPPEHESTFAGQLNGIALADVLGCTMALHTRAPERFQSAFDKPMDSSKAGVIENLTEAYDYCIGGLKTMSDVDVLQTATYKGRRETRFDIFWDAYARTTFMLGQADMFMRSKGLTPSDVGPKYDF